MSDKTRKAIDKRETGKAKPPKMPPKPAEPA